MAPKRRRSSEFLLVDEEPDLRILVAGQDAPLMAHTALLRLYSHCVYNLPRSTDGGPTTWDLRELVLEGEAQPVAAATVQAWLDLVYCCSRTDAKRAFEAPSCLDDAKPLPLFADAAGTVSTLMEDLAHKLCKDTALTMRAELSGGQAISLRLRGALYYYTNGNLKWRPVPFIPSSDVTEAAGMDKARMSAATCSALERWLYLAGRLQMEGLVRMLLDFTRMQLTPSEVGIILPADLASVFSKRVWQCMPESVRLECFVAGALLHRPTAVTIDGKDLQVTLLDPTLASMFAHAPATSVQASITGRELCAAGDGAAYLRIAAGMSAEDGEQVVQSTVASVLADT